VSDAELKMAAQLVGDMTKPFKADDYRDSFKDEVMALVHRKAEAGQTETVVQPEAAETSVSKSADIIDLTELRKRSLKSGTASAKTAPAKTAAAKNKRTG